MREDLPECSAPARGGQKSRAHSAPECDGCGARGYYGVCRDCATRDHEAEPRNHHVAHGHNRFNFCGW